MNFIRIFLWLYMNLLSRWMHCAEIILWWIFCTKNTSWTRSKQFNKILLQPKFHLLCNEIFCLFCQHSIRWSPNEAGCRKFANRKFQTDLAYTAHATTRHRVVLIRAPSYVTAEVRVYSRFVLLPFYTYPLCVHNRYHITKAWRGWCREEVSSRQRVGWLVDFGLN